MAAVAGSLVPSQEKLLEVMTKSTKMGIILVDETTTDKNESDDRANVHCMQAKVLLQATTLGFPIFLVGYGMEGAHGEKSVFDGGLGNDLDTAIPVKTYRYGKGVFETDGFVNTTLKTDVKSSGVTDVIIMGQSVNACCAATGRGAALLGLKVHTCGLIVRGGSAKTEAPNHYWGMGWPDKTTVYTSL